MVGSRGGDAVEIRVSGREFPDATDYWDANWLVAPVDVVVGGFRASIRAQLRAEELARFRSGLERLYETLEGEALLESIEEWITLRVVCLPTGQLDVEGDVTDSPGIGNRLTFAIDGLDQTYLPPAIAALREIESRYPVIGAP